MLACDLLLVGTQQCSAADNVDAGGIGVPGVPAFTAIAICESLRSACQVAAYFKARKPRSKVLLLDANADVTSKGPLFKKAWNDLYKGII